MDRKRYVRSLEERLERVKSILNAVGITVPEEFSGRDDLDDDEDGDSDGELSEEDGEQIGPQQQQKHGHQQRASSASLGSLKKDEKLCACSKSGLSGKHYNVLKVDSREEEKYYGRY